MRRVWLGCSGESLGFTKGDVGPESACLVALRTTLPCVDARGRLTGRGNAISGYKGEGHVWFKPTKITLNLKGKDLLEIVVMNKGATGGLLIELVDKKGKVRARSDRSCTARRADAEARPALVLGPPLSGPWLAFLSDRRKPPIVAMRGSWIWHP